MWDIFGEYSRIFFKTLMTSHKELRCLFTRPLDQKATDLQMVNAHVRNIGLGLAEGYIQLAPHTL